MDVDSVAHLFVHTLSCRSVSFSIYQDSEDVILRCPAFLSIGFVRDVARERHFHNVSI